MKVWVSEGPATGIHTQQGHRQERWRNEIANVTFSPEFNLVGERFVW